MMKKIEILKKAVEENKSDILKNAKREFTTHQINVRAKLIIPAMIECDEFTHENKKDTYSPFNKLARLLSSVYSIQKIEKMAGIKIH